MSGSHRAPPSEETERDLSTTIHAPTATTSTAPTQAAHPPPVWMPGKAPPTQCMSSPARHGRHNPQVMSGCRIPASPTATVVTADPTSAIQPAFSCPMVYGKSTPVFGAHCPSQMWMSVRQTPAPPIFTITSKGPVICGSGTSSTVGHWSYSCRRTAFMSAPSSSPDVAFNRSSCPDSDERTGVGRGAVLREATDRVGQLLDPCATARVGQLLALCATAHRRRVRKARSVGFVVSATAWS